MCVCLCYYVKLNSVDDFYKQLALLTSVFKLDPSLTPTPPSSHAHINMHARAHTHRYTINMLGKREHPCVFGLLCETK